MNITLILEGNPLTEIPAAIAKLDQAEALEMVPFLKGGLKRFDFCLGGVLQVIKDNKWWKASHTSWVQYVIDNCYFGERQAQYLMETYRYLVAKQIPWDNVAQLGSTKLRYLTDAGVLTAENVEEVVSKYTPMTVKAIENELKFGSQPTIKHAALKVTPPESWKASAAPVIGHTAEEAEEQENAPEEQPQVTLAQVRAYLEAIGEGEAVKLVKQIYPGVAWSAAA